MNGRYTAIIILFLSFLLFPSAVMAEEWVPVGIDQTAVRITDAVVSGDGAYGAFVGNAGIMMLTADGAECWRIPDRRYRSLSLSGDGAVLAAGGDGILVMHQNTTVLAALKTKNYVNDLAITADGSRIAVALDDETLHLYSPKGDLVWSVDTVDDLISVAISPDGTYIVGGTSAGNVVFFSDAGEERWTYGLSRKPVTAVALSDNARTIAAASADGTVALLSRAGSLLWSGSAPRAGGVAVTADGATVAIADQKGIRFIQRDGTSEGQITTGDASVATAMDGSGRWILLTDGTRIKGFITKNTGPTEEAPLIEQVPEETVSTIATAHTQSPPVDTPVSTGTPFPIFPVVAALIISARYVVRRL